MPLHLDGLYAQVIQLAQTLPAEGSSQQLNDVQAFLRQADPGQLRDKLRQRKSGARIPWLVAIPLVTLAARFRLPPLPDDFSVAAADGSSIPPDRHSSVRYFVLNTGHAVLTYGSHPNADLDATSMFCFSDADLYFDPQGKRIPIEGTRLGILMGIEEMIKLSEVAQKAPRPTVAVRDGSLILWNLQTEEGEIKSAYLHRFLGALDQLRDAGVPLCSYISYPGSQDVINSLRLLACDDGTRKCQDCPQQTEIQALCQVMGTLRDRLLFRSLLRPGERSDIFESESAILKDYGPHHIQFFYLNVGDEIARVEAPQWVMADPAMLDLVHAVLVDQCRRSAQYPPYPSVLIEAHEQAVISTGDRTVVESLLEQALAEQGIFYVRSAKDRSKRARGV
ncbi:MAG: DNA double-strand break repair nuclease NurA [Anaerolineae bacterium]|nr:DNA double-strand break repair nuclease NurA [Anaerolineae bacterium]